MNLNKICKQKILGHLLFFNSMFGFNVIMRIKTNRDTSKNDLLKYKSILKLNDG